MRILHDEIMLAGGTEELMNNYRTIVTRWQKAPKQDIEQPPKTGGGGVQTQLYEKFFVAMFDADEQQRLGVMRDQLKDKLAEIGGLVR